MIGALVGAGIGLAGNVIGGAQASSAAQKAEEEARRQRQKNKDWFDRVYNENYLQTAESQYALNKAREYALEQLSSSLGRQAVTGGTEESVDATRANANKLVADTTGQLAAQGTARKDAARNQYLQSDNKASEALQSAYNAQAQASTQAANEAMKAGMGLVGLDMQSRLQTGKSLFNNLFKKGGQPSTGLQ